MAAVKSEELVQELRVIRNDLNHAENARLVSLAITDLQSSGNWLSRLLNEEPDDEG